MAATLTASDGVNTPVSDTAIVTVNAPNTAPTVYAGPDQTDIARHPVSLPGIVTDPDNIPTVHWANGSGHCVFGNPFAIVTTITCDTAGIYAATLTADDGVNAPVSDTAIITFTPPSCTESPASRSVTPAPTKAEPFRYRSRCRRCSPRANVTVTATIVPVPGGAINGYGLATGAVQDFKSNPIHNLTIKAGARQAWVAVKALTDNVSGEAPETFKVVLSSPAGVTGISLGRSVGTGTILDANGVPAGQLMVGSTSMVEGDACSTCKFTAKVSVVMAGPKAVGSVNYSTVGTGTETAPTNFTAKLNKVLSWTATGATAKTLTVITIGNNTPAGAQGINFVFSGPTGAINGPLPPAVVTIIDND